VFLLAFLNIKNSKIIPQERGFNFTQITVFIFYFLFFIFQVQNKIKTIKILFFYLPLIIIKYKKEQKR